MIMKQVNKAPLLFKEGLGVVATLSDQKPSPKLGEGWVGSTI